MIGALTCSTVESTVSEFEETFFPSVAIACNSAVEDCKRRGVDFDDFFASTATSRYTAVGEDECGDEIPMPGFEVAAALYKRRHSRRRTRKPLNYDLCIDEEEDPGAFEADCNLKDCPQCGNPVTKSSVPFDSAHRSLPAFEEECDRVITGCACGKRYCWTCMADFDVILHHGAHYHRRTCRFFVEYEGPEPRVFRKGCCLHRQAICIPP